MARRPVIAILGGGFSGTMLAAQLIRQATAPLELLLFDAEAAFAQGAAYSTHDPLHLLNVPAARMSALPDEPTHLLDWLRAHEPDWKVKLPELKDTHYDEGAFIPRALYALYLSALLTDAQIRAKEKNISLTLHAARITQANFQETQWHLRQEDGTPRIADRLVLATGNPPARSFPVEGSNEAARYLPHLWSEAGKKFLKEAKVANLDHPIVIIGTGLTMVDAVLTLAARGLSRPIIAISRHAKLPTPHAPATLPWSLTGDLSTFSIARRMRRLRDEIAAAAKEGVSWHAVIDALRPVTAPLWQSLPLAAQKTFLRHAWNLWNIHRHRMPRSSHSTLSGLQARGRLELHAGTIDRIDATRPDEVTVHWRTRSKETKQQVASYVLNCTGPEMQLSRIANPLLRQLVQSGALLPHPLGIGAQMAEDGSLAGTAQGALFGIGPLLLGDRLETTAVPELRVQAQWLANRLLTGA